jgi:hypothetical protein
MDVFPEPVMRIIDLQNEGRPWGFELQKKDSSSCKGGRIPRIRSP